MENENVINLQNLRDDAFFAQVNDSERAKTNAKARKQAEHKSVMKLLYKSFYCFGIGLVLALFGVFGAVAPFLSFSSAIVSTHLSMFYFGRFYSTFRGKKW